MTLGEFIGDWLKKNDRGRRWLARRSGISHTYVLDLLKDKWQPAPDKIRKLALAMDVPYTKLMILAGHLTLADLSAVQKESQSQIPPDLMAALRDPEMVKMFGKLWKWKIEDPPVDLQSLCDRILSLPPDQMALVEGLIKQMAPRPSTT